MKVKYIGKFDNVTWVQHASTWYLSLGNEYLVMELLSSVKKGVFYRLIGDNEDASPIVYPASEFEIITALIPTNWSLSITRKKDLIVNGPTVWRKPNFWKACYDRDLKALEVFEREARIIYKEEEELNKIFLETLSKLNKKGEIL